MIKSGVNSKTKEINASYGWYLRDDFGNDGIRLGLCLGLGKMEERPEHTVWARRLVGGKMLMGKAHSHWELVRNEAAQKGTCMAGSGGG